MGKNAVHCKNKFTFPVYRCDVPVSPLLHHKLEKQRNLDGLQREFANCEEEWTKVEKVYKKNKCKQQQSMFFNAYKKWYNSGRLGNTSRETPRNQQMTGRGELYLHAY